MNTTRCQDIYTEAEYPGLYSQFHNYIDPNKYASIDWQCLPPGSIPVLNDIWTADNGFSTSISISYCYEMAVRLNFDASTCVTDQTELSSTTHKFEIKTMVINKYFNVQNYTESGDLVYKNA